MRRSKSVLGTRSGCGHLTRLVNKFGHWASGLLGFWNMLSSITVDRLKVVDRELKPAEKPGETGSNLDHDTQGALLRFARFINKESEGRKAPPQKRKTVPSKDAAKSHPYAQSMAVLNRHMDSGLTIDIYV